MKAIRIHSYGGPEVLRLEELPTPAPGAGEALIRIHAASVNFLDVQKRRGELYSITSLCGFAINSKGAC